MVTKEQKNYSAPALEKGLDILEYLAFESVPRNQAQIAEALQRKQSEIYRMLTCLERRGYIRREGGLYGLTLRLYQIGRSQQLVTELRRAARIPMETLAEATGQSCHLSTQHAGELMVMLERCPAKRLCLSVGEGSTFPLWRTASGRVMLGMVSEQERFALLEQNDDFQALPSSIKKRVYDIAKATQKHGYLAQSSDITDGVYDIAVDIGVNGDLAVLALSCLELPAESEKAKKTLLVQVQQCAEQINQNLGLLINQSHDRD